MVVKPRIRRGRFVLNRYAFSKGGENDVITIDFIGDEAQGFGTPARSLLLVNHGGGIGSNYLYFRTSEDGRSWDRVSTMLPDTTEIYPVVDNCVFSQIQIWASCLGLTMSLRATPGDWTFAELKRYVPNPAPSAEKDVLEKLADMVI